MGGMSRGEMAREQSEHSPSIAKPQASLSPTVRHIIQCLGSRFHSMPFKATFYPLDLCRNERTVSAEKTHLEQNLLSHNWIL
jgi:hypothetical protein